MDVLLLLLMVSLGFVGSFFSGLLGIGGAIISYPMLLFIPPALGVAQFSAQEVSVISMFQVFFASLSGVLAFRKRNGNNSPLIHKGLVRDMGVSILAGSLIGAALSQYLSNESINLVYGILAIIAVILMLVKNRGTEAAAGEVTYNRFIAAGAAFAVGIVSGIVGAGGAFILIPIMLTVLKIPTRVTIASSLAIVFISAIGGVIGKLSGGQIPLLPVLYTVIGSVLGAPVGSMVSAKSDVKYLRYGLIVLISGTAIKIWSDIL
ncbi:sulfite exporter TauE/SafE family protein [Brevibacillus sp. DP1.3A]|uniref:sulfite exporter TauE/SafE family protein n=1 Tax=Brevibacillus sp. DP1.3A TaxID=2738867 RepID=UPI00156B27C2|nr:sulfite exporter TauE/SafE family protein [Brevibacillus sp. DP1.3A]MED1914041.1 sulfite exporter TauE/SafE family protein [Bacillus thuringiensis]UED75025.1 sulfite exporter TauE/SafE family protein [Brevibacillus sp. DP1.3A]